jgi:hypothetical protein
MIVFGFSVYFVPKSFVAILLECSWTSGLASFSNRNAMVDQLETRPICQAFRRNS